MKKYLLGFMVLILLPLASADIIDPNSPSVDSSIINIADFPNYTFVMVYEAPHPSRGPSFIKIIHQNGNIPRTTRYGDYASLYAIENSKLEDNYLLGLWDKIDKGDYDTKDSLTNEAKQYLLTEGVLIIDYLMVSSSGYRGTVDVEYTLTGLEKGDYTVTRNGVDVTAGMRDDVIDDDDSDNYLIEYMPWKYLIWSLIALVVIGYVISRRKTKKSKKARKSKSKRKK